MRLALVSGPRGVIRFEIVSHLLSNLPAGSSGVLSAVGGSRAHRRRLLELGFVPGTRLTLIRRLEVGNVLEVELRESRVSLRISEADVLHLEPDAESPS